MFALGEDTSQPEIRIVQGALEGLAARMVTARGLTPTDANLLTDLLDRADAILGLARQTPTALASFVVLDADFHGTLIRLSRSAVLARHLEPGESSPYPSAALAQYIATDPNALHRLFSAEQDQHRAIVTAMRDGDGDRAEALVRDHALLAASLGFDQPARPVGGAAASL